MMRKKNNRIQIKIKNQKMLMNSKFLNINNNISMMHLITKFCGIYLIQLKILKVDFN